MIKVVEIFPYVRLAPAYIYIVSIMAPDNLAMQGATASATMILI